MKFSRFFTVTSMVLLVVLAFATQAMAVADNNENSVPNRVNQCLGIAARGTLAGCFPDTDGDGLDDSVDLCPSVYGLGLDGCPLISEPIDTDSDGVLDNVDLCPLVYGLGSDGCPVVTIVETLANDQPSGGQVFDLVDLLEFTVTDTEAQSMALIVAESNEDGEQIINIYDVNEDGSREVALTLTADYIAQFDIIPDVNTTLWTNQTGEITLYHLTTGEFQINVGPDELGNVYEIIFDTVPDYNPYRKQWNVYDVLDPVQSDQ